MHNSKGEHFYDEFAIPKKSRKKRKEIGVRAQLQFSSSIVRCVHAAPQKSERAFADRLMYGILKCSICVYFVQHTSHI